MGLRNSMMETRVRPELWITSILIVQLPISDINNDKFNTPTNDNIVANVIEQVTAQNNYQTSKPVSEEDYYCNNNCIDVQ